MKTFRQQGFQVVPQAGTCSIQWILNKKFLRLNLTLNYSDGKSVEFLEFVGVSTSKKGLRRWIFDQTGANGESSSVQFENALPGQYQIEWIRKNDDGIGVRDFMTLSGDELFLSYGCKDTDTKEATQYEARIFVHLVRASDSD